MLIIFANNNIQSSRLQILHFIIYGAQWRVHPSDMVVHQIGRQIGIVGSALLSFQLEWF